MAREQQYTHLFGRDAEVWLQHQALRSMSIGRSTWGMSTYYFGRVLFPGALNSEFTDKLSFIQPSQQDAIPTYRVMNQYGEIIDKEIGVETEDEEALQIYKNMVKRQSCQE
jgi:hypothetical protein